MTRMSERAIVIFYLFVQKTTEKSARGPTHAPFFKRFATDSPATRSGRWGSVSAARFGPSAATGSVSAASLTLVSAAVRAASGSVSGR